MSKAKAISKPYLKVGRIVQTIAQQAHITSADIYVSRNQLIHIENRHGKELAAVGMDAETFVRTVCRQYNQIRRGSNNSLLLVVYDEKLAKVAAIDLNYSLKDSFWEIKTAEPRECSTVKKKALIWARAHPANGNGVRFN